MNTDSYNYVGFTYIRSYELNRLYKRKENSCKYNNISVPSSFLTFNGVKIGVQASFNFISKNTSSLQ